jgi:hypothetical protein
MRISFPNKEHEDTLVGAGETLRQTIPSSSIAVASRRTMCDCAWAIVASN